mgnify:CR=1 FL=1
MDYNLQKYIAFITAVDNGSITGASEILNYSQSGISRMIGDLEKDWQMSLLERNKYGVELTSDGVRLLPQIRAVCNEFQKLTTDVEELQGLETGLIRIGTISSEATHVLPPVIQKFKNDYKGVKYELLLGDYNEIEEWVQSGRVDIGFVLMPTKDSLLPELILKRCAYDIEIKSLEEPFIREMGIIMKDRERLPIAVKRLLKYLV